MFARFRRKRHRPLIAGYSQRPARAARPPAFHAHALRLASAHDGSGRIDRRAWSAAARRGPGAAAARCLQSHVRPRHGQFRARRSLPRDPRAGWPRRGRIQSSPPPAPAHILDVARVFDSAEAAIAHLNFVYVADLARERGQAKPVSHAQLDGRARPCPRRDAARRSGPERTRLNNDEAALAESCSPSLTPCSISRKPCCSSSATKFGFKKPPMASAPPRPPSVECCPSRPADAGDYHCFGRRSLTSPGSSNPTARSPACGVPETHLHCLEMTEQDVLTRRRAARRGTTRQRADPQAQPSIKAPPDEP